MNECRLRGPVIDRRVARRLVLLLCSVFLTQTASHAQQSPIVDLDEYVAKSVREWGVPGLSIAVVKNDTVVFAKGYGVRKIGETAPVDEHTLFAIGSSSKAFTTAALAMLVDEGKVEWDAPVRRYLPTFQLSDPYVSHELRVRDLLSHRIGLDRGDYLWYVTQFDRNEVLRRAQYLKQVKSFRYNWGYNNIMFLAGGQIIPATTGKTWDDFIRERIFQPLGMTETNTSVRDLQAAGNVANPHVWKAEKAQPISWRNIDNIAPAGSINSNAVDLAQWVRLQLNGGTFGGRRLISAEAIEEMHDPQMIMPRGVLHDELSLFRAFWPSETHFMSYGLGWFLEDYRGRKVIHHGGSIDGMNALVAMLPEEKLGVVILSNLSRDGYVQVLPALMWKVFDAYLGVPPHDWSSEYLQRVKLAEEKEQKTEASREEAEQRTPIGKPSLELSKYAGRYVNCAMGDARIVQEGAGLTLQGSPFAGLMKHWRFDTFQLTWTDLRANATERTSFVNFTLNRQGLVEEMRVSEYGEPDELAFLREPEGAEANWIPQACR